jgi:hypothetical protein
LLRTNTLAYYNRTEAALNKSSILQKI